MSQPYYVTLTGARNNAGDYLIRHRGHHLLRTVRPDRDLRDRNAWLPFSEEALEEINGAAALILLGGPALRRDMYPAVYPLTDDLAKIKVPIAIMGAGWHATPGTWEDSRDYRFTPATRGLLQRVAKDDAGLSVRDFRSLNALQRAGIRGGIMTGCPALYVPERYGQPLQPLHENGPRSIVFSTGVTMIRSAAVMRQTKDLIKQLIELNDAAEFTVAFHHSIDFAALRASYGAGQNASADRHQELVQWLETEGITYADLSGGVEALLDLYGRADFHVGYRVHGHILMSSLRKPSVLLTEDGRGRGLKDVLGGIIYDTWAYRVPTVKERLLQKAGKKMTDKLIAYDGIGEDILHAVSYEMVRGYPRLGQPGGRIDELWGGMEDFLRGLP